MTSQAPRFGIPAAGDESPVVRVARLGSGDTARWDAYVEAHPDGSFFHLAGWREVLESGVRFPTEYLYAERGGRIVGVLPLARVKSLLFGHALVSLPFCVEGGVIADDEVALHALLDEASAVAEASGVDHLELRHARRQAPAWPCKDALYVSFRKALAPSVEANLSAIPRKQRAMVRKGIAAGLESREETGLDRFFTVYATSVRNLGTPVFSRRYFETLQRVFADRCRITTVFHREQAVASVLSFLHKGAVMPYYGGGLPLARELKAYDFMYWEVMRTACEQGFTHFDYGRSKRDSGSFAFKKNWGFEPVPLCYEYRLVRQRELPDRNPNNPKYERAIALWKRLPLPVANALGPYISPYVA